MILRKNILLFLLILGGHLIGQSKKPNILFIPVDDLRPELGCYGNQKIKTPNIDRLAKSGSCFQELIVNRRFVILLGQVY